MVKDTATDTIVVSSTMSEYDKKYIEKVYQRGIYWARMTGFPFWPGRYCSLFELMNFPMKKSAKVQQAPISFLGVRNDKGMVPMTAIAPFTADNWDTYFDQKLFKKDKDYRVAIHEAIRVQGRQGHEFPDYLQDLFNTYHTSGPELIGLDLPSEICVACDGTNYSGIFYDCYHCKQRGIHYCCLNPGLTTALLGGVWYCDSCCQVLGHKPGLIHPYPNDNEVVTEKGSEGVADDKNGKKMKTKRKKQSEDGLTKEDSNNSNEVNSGTITEHVLMGSTEDNCFVCGSDHGNLILCDFPGCVKVYHQMCVIRVCNLPLADDSIGADVFSNTDNSGDGLDDTSTWFCPRHHCISCHALQTTECSLAAIVLPIQYYSNNTQFHRSCNYVSTEIVHNKDSPGKNGLTKSGDKGVGRKPKRPLSISNSEEDLLDSQNSGTVSSSTTKASASPPKSKKRGRPAFKTKDVDFVSPDNVLDSSESASISHENCTQRPLSLYRNLIQKDLKQCSTCPFSICRECERDLSPHTQLIAERRYIVEPECLNCSSKDCKLSLAKVLEKAWIMMVTSRLAIPFLMPLLPISDLRGWKEEKQARVEVKRKPSIEVSRSLRPNRTRIDLKTGEREIRTPDKSAEEKSLEKDDFITISINQNIKKWSTNSDQSSNGANTINNLIDIFDKIRRLQYNTVQEYNSDINTLRNKVVEKVNYYFDSKLHQNSDSDSGSDCDVSMNSGSDSSNEKVVKSGRSEQKNMGNSTRTNGAKLLNKSVKEQSTNELPQRDRDETLKLILSAFETIADASYTVLVKKRLILEEIEVVGVTRKSVSGEDINGESSVGASSSDEEIFQEIISFDSQELMKRLWRRECDEKVVCLVEAPTYTPFSDVTIDQVNGKRHFKFLPLPPARVTVYKRLQLVCQERSKFEFLVAPKSMQSWLYFIDYGFIMPKKYRGSDDPYGLDGKINSSISFCNSTDAARENTKRILEEGSGYDSMLLDNHRAARLLLDMDHSLGRETVTLLEGATSLPKTTRSIYNGEASDSEVDGHIISNTIAPDETILMFDRLRELSEKSLNLERRLREEHLHKQRKLLDTSSASVTIGEANLITELKLANDNLRWRLAQRNNVINSNKQMIHALQVELQNCRSDLDIVTKERDSLRNSGK